MSLIEMLAEANRMDYNTFVRRVEQYMRKKGINLNGSIPTKDLRQGYQDGLFPSKFVKNYVRQLNDQHKMGRHVPVNEKCDKDDG